MNSFDLFFKELIVLVSTHEKNNTPLKVQKDLEADIVKIFGDNVSALTRAKNGLNDVFELAYATAEHHPYWNLLYHCSEITNVILEKWKENLSQQDISDIEWSLKELKHSLEKFN